MSNPMEPNMELSVAIDLTASAFVNKMDKGGKPYILHCLSVMHGVENLGMPVMAAAVLHDLLEDTEYTIKDLYKLGFSPYVIRMVSVCTHVTSMTYEDYIVTVAKYTETRAIKMSDLQHNMRPDRLPNLSDDSMRRIRKYHEAYQFLLKCTHTSLYDELIEPEKTIEKSCFTCFYLSNNQCLNLGCYGKECRSNGFPFWKSQIKPD